MAQRSGGVGGFTPPTMGSLTLDAGSGMTGTGTGMPRSASSGSLAGMGMSGAGVGLIPSMRTMLDPARGGGGVPRSASSGNLARMGQRGGSTMGSPMLDAGMGGTGTGMGMPRSASSGNLAGNMGGGMGCGTGGGMRFTPTMGMVLGSPRVPQNGSSGNMGGMGGSGAGGMSGSSADKGGGHRRTSSVSSSSGGGGGFASGGSVVHSPQSMAALAERDKQKLAEIQSFFASGGLGSGGLGLGRRGSGQWGVGGATSNQSPRTGMSPNASPPVTSPSRGAAGAGLGGERGGSGAGLGGERGAGAGLGGERGGAGAGGGGKRGGRGGKKGVLGLILGPIRTPSPSEYYRLGSPGGGGWMGRVWGQRGEGEKQVEEKEEKGEGKEKEKEKEKEKVKEGEDWGKYMGGEAYEESEDGEGEEGEAAGARGKAQGKRAVMGAGTDAAAATAAGEATRKETAGSTSRATVGATKGAHPRARLGKADVKAMAQAAGAGGKSDAKSTVQVGAAGGKKAKAKAMVQAAGAGGKADVKAVVQAGAGGGAGGGKVDVRALVQGALEEWRRTEAAAMQQLSTSVLGRGLSDVRKVYQLGKELGRGNFGVIREAVDWVSGERFACKSVNKKRLECVDDIGDLRREVEVMRSVKGHPNIVSLVDTYEDDTDVHMVMELCEGGELFDRIVARKHYGERQAAQVCRTLADVLRYCHSQRILHRDLKPENVLLVSTRSDTRVKVIDFGMAYRFQDGERCTQRAGTPNYISPEVIAKNYSTEADVWSLGVILYVMLCGLPPFWGDSTEEIFSSILHEPLDLETEPWPDVSAAAKDLVRRMLCRRFDERITVPEILSEWALLACGLSVL
ncbi:unnamed protein product [Closterium sp. NIES-65]|nr:unnamed protein product [Closterium sp. NIES-65]